MKYTYLVHGAGRQGTAAVYDLIKNCEAKEVRVVDPSEIALKEAEARLQELWPCDEVVLNFATKPDYENIDVVLSCAPYFVNLTLTEEAIAHGVHFCDLGGNPEIVRRQAAAAKGASTAVVPECGVSPGISNILAVHMAKQGAQNLEVRCGGIPTDPDVNQLGYKLVFSADGLMSEYTGTVPVIKDGIMEHVEALSTIEPRSDGLVASPTSNNAPEVVETLLSYGVKNYNYKTLRYPGHWNAMKCILALGLSKEEIVEKFNSNRELQYDLEEDTDRLILEVTGTRVDGITTTWEYLIDIKACRKTLFSAMELLTSWGITMVAHQIASTDPTPGFWTSEQHIDHHRIIRDLNKRLVDHES